MLSPFPWISDEVWSIWNSSPVRDRDLGSPIHEPLVTRVTESDRERAGQGSRQLDNAAPALAQLEEQNRLLASTVSLGFLSQVRWPVCCNRLATLIQSCGAGQDLDEIELGAGNLGSALLESHVDDGGGDLSILLAEWSKSLSEMRAGSHSGDGINLFSCRACGRVYGSFSEP